ncbi:MAG: Rrf2 family transcriptional regulator [Pirellulaceae bacterium]|nr:Rrf2 family transcriptional regulator [Pirellulaceae bacterium]
MFSQTAEYALRAVIWLAEHQNEGPVGNKRIAEDTQVPASYLSKILHDLASAGFLSSRRGVGGGFRLIISPDVLTLLDVINAVDPLKRIEPCTHSSEVGFGQLCPMHQRLDEAIESVERTLGNSTIREMIQTPVTALPYA